MQCRGHGNIVALSDKGLSIVLQVITLLCLSNLYILCRMPNCSVKPPEQDYNQISSDLRGSQSYFV